MIKRDLWPSQARKIAFAHNDEYHNGVPTAEIDVDELSVSRWDDYRLPRYKVTCPVCKSED